VTYHFHITSTHLEVRIGWRTHEDTALTLASVVLGTTAEADVTRFTPRRSPGVLDLVEVKARGGVSAVTDGKDTVIQVGSAITSEDTRLVELEGGLVSLDGDRDWLLVQGRHQSRVRSGGNISVGDWGNAGNLWLGGVASTSGPGGARDVWVVGLSGKTAVLLGPGEGIVHQATVAAVISATVGQVVAINQVLLREGLERTSLELVSTFQSTSGRERPAGAALALVLDTSDSTSGDPVNRGGEGRDVSRSLVDVGSLLLRIWAGKTKANEGSPLVDGHVGELVVAKGEGAVARVVSLDQIFVVGEVLEHVDEVLTRLGLNLVFLEPVEELLFVVGTVVDIASKSGSSHGSENSGAHFC